MVYLSHSFKCYGHENDHPCSVGACFSSFCELAKTSAPDTGSAAENETACQSSEESYEIRTYNIYIFKWLE